MKKKERGLRFAMKTARILLALVMVAAVSMPTAIFAGLSTPAAEATADIQEDAGEPAEAIEEIPDEVSLPDLDIGAHVISKDVIEQPEAIDDIMALDDDLTLLNSSTNVIDVGDDTLANGTDWEFDSSVFTITGQTSITIEGTTDTNRVVVQSGVTANITLKNVAIENVSGGSPISVEPGATANITLVGDNVLTADTDPSARDAGLHVPDGAAVVIYGTDADTLTVTGSSGGYYGGAGIGGAYDQKCGEITIRGGTIITDGGPATAGIGNAFTGWNYCEAGDIIISGGKVTATGGEAAAGIGGGSGNGGGNITISGSSTEVTARGGSAGIGGGSGYYPGFGGTIVITDGATVEATGDGRAAGIGGGYESSGYGGGGVNITISNGAIIKSATGGSDGGAGIGGGVENFMSVDITITGGAVVMAAQGGSGGAGIGDGNQGYGSIITIKGIDTNVTAKGGTGSAGIGATSTTLTIDDTATVQAYSDTDYAIRASNNTNLGTAVLQNNYFAADPTGGSPFAISTVPASSTLSLVLPAGYRSFAYTAPNAAAAVRQTAKTGGYDQAIVIDGGLNDGNWDIPGSMAATPVKFAPIVKFDTGDSVFLQAVANGSRVIKPADPTKTGYTFDGWYKDAKYTNEWDFASDTVTSPGGATLYAKWTLNGGTPTPTVYRVIKHFDDFTGSGTSTTIVDADHKEFTRLTLGGAEISPSNYTITEGSTVITLHETHLKTYANGTYIFKAEYRYGVSDDIRLIVNVQGTGSNYNNGGTTGSGGTTPRTGDGMNLMLWWDMGALALVALGALGVYTWRKRRSPKLKI